MQMSTLERQVRLVEENERRGLGGGVDACKSPIRGFWGCYGPTDFFKCLQETKKVPVNASHVCLQPRGKAAELQSWTGRRDTNAEEGSVCGGRR